MNVSKSEYYKWKYRQKNPSLKDISRQSDIKLIREIHEKHQSHGYRWINAYAKNKYGIIWSDKHVHLCCKYEGIRSTGKHYQWKKPRDEQCKFNNLIWNGWIKEELFIDFDLKHSKDVTNLIRKYIYYYNNERPLYALKYKTPIQYKIESWF